MSTNVNASLRENIQCGATFAMRPSIIATGIALSLMMTQSPLIFAQQAAPQAASPVSTQQAIERIEVTGSRIPAPNLEGASPVTVVDAGTIKTDGLRSVENLLNNLPQVFADQGANVSNGSTGTAAVNLRNLGAQRVLVLVNGRRLPNGAPNSIGADLNQIPAALIKRVEILTGGASAVYGSDAIAGVINFIMNDKFEGVQVQVNSSFYNHKQQSSSTQDLIRARSAASFDKTQFVVPGNNSADGKINDANITLGSNFANGKGNATVFFAYKKEDALLQRDRDFSACGLTSNGVTNGAKDGYTCGGSSTSSTGRVMRLDDFSSYTAADAVGTSRPFRGATDAYNFNPTNYYQRPSERYSFNAFANYDIYDNAKLYTEFSFHNDNTVAQVAPGGIFFTNTIFTLRADNPLLSTTWRTNLGLTTPGSTQDVWIGRRNVEGGGRTSSFNTTSFRTLIGLKGEVGNWYYDVFALTSKVQQESIQDNFFSASRSKLAIDVVRDPVTGNIVCRSALSGLSPNCVPYNLFAVGGVTPQARAFLQTPGVTSGSTEQSIQGGSISTDLGSYGIKLPTAKNGIGVALGVERRTEKLRFNTDQPTRDGDLDGSGGPNLGIAGAKFTVNEIFGEVRAPLIEGAALAELLSVSATYRHSSYDQPAAKTDTYGLGFEWAPVKQARFRGSYQQAVRAPDLLALYTVPAKGLVGIGTGDPCEGTPTATVAQCQLTGLSPALYGNVPANLTTQYSGFISGTATLKPEKAKSSTLGVVLTPIRDLSVTLDYFNIKVEDIIGAIPAATVLTQCLTTGASIYCNRIKRDQVGTLYSAQSFITQPQENLGSLKTSGVDVGFNYNKKIDAYGGLAVTFLGTYLKSSENEPVKGLGSYDCKGLYGGTCGTPSPVWRHKARLAWATPWAVDVAITWRHFDKVKIDATSSNPLLTGLFNDVDAVLSARDYIDLAGAWQVTKQLSISGGINNVFDKDPPLSGNTSPAFGNGNTYPQVYDALGRRVFLNATYKF